MDGKRKDDGAGVVCDDTAGRNVALGDGAKPETAATAKREAITCIMMAAGWKKRGEPRGFCVVRASKDSCRRIKEQILRPTLINGEQVSSLN